MFAGSATSQDAAGSILASRTRKSRNGSTPQSSRFWGVFSCAPVQPCAISPRLNPSTVVAFPSRGLRTVPWSIDETRRCREPCAESTKRSSGNTNDVGLMLRWRACASPVKTRSRKTLTTRPIRQVRCSRRLEPLWKDHTRLKSACAIFNSERKHLCVSAHTLVFVSAVGRQPESMRWTR